MKLLPDEASAALAGLAGEPATETLPLHQAAGRTAAEEITAALPNPPFRRSAFDGYAFLAADTAQAAQDAPALFSIVDELPAGTPPAGPLSGGAAVRIFTGAPVPDGADAVAPQEQVVAKEGVLRIFSAYRSGDNVAPVGEDVPAGAVLVRRGDRLGAASLALIAGQGRADVRVYKRPRVALISTGSELLKAGDPLEPGKIYNTNVFVIGGYLQALGTETVDCGIVTDVAENVAAAIGAALSTCDAVLLTGGASVGDYDYSLSAMQKLGGRMLFDRVAMKPGGAMLAAEIQGKAVVGLSGNPGAAALGLLRVAAPLIKKLCGQSETQWPLVSVRLLADMKKASPQTRFVRGRLVIRDGTAYLEETGRQVNGAVSSLVGCDLVGVIPAGSPPLGAGTVIHAYRILF